MAERTELMLQWAKYGFTWWTYGAMASLALASGIAVWGTVHGHGPFVQQTLNKSLLLLQTFVGVLAVTVLFLAAALAERRHAEQSRRLLIERLEQALSQITTLRGLILICAQCKSVRTKAGSWEQLDAYLRDHTEVEFSHSICPECLEKRPDEITAQR